MFARLWWKEFRLFWPVWAFLVVLALVAQPAAIWFFGREAQGGALALMAVGWSFLYAAAVASAAFAGEREQKTLRFLDTLPVPRNLLWRSKASFAIVTTLALEILLLLHSLLGTDLENPTFQKTATVMTTLSCLVLLLGDDRLGPALVGVARECARGRGACGLLDRALHSVDDATG